MTKYLIYNSPHPIYGGKCLVYRFPNLYGACVNRHQKSQGGIEGFWEVTLIKFTGEGNRFALHHHEQISPNPQGYLFIDEVYRLLCDIEKLEPVADKAQ